MYERCSVKLADMGIFHSANSCRDKIKKLKQDYKKIKDHNNKSGNGRKTSKWYDRLDALLGHRPSFSGTLSTIDSGTLVWEAAETADSVACELCDDEGEAGQLSGLETSELSPPDHNSSTCSSPFPPSKRKRKRARPDNFIDTIEAMEDRRAEASKENEDRRAMVSKEIREEQLVHSRKAQEAEEQLLMVMARQADVSARQVEQQNTFQIGLLGVLSELVQSNRPSSL
ncbi:Myb/SANT-like DNA-binding domain containing protein 2 [Dissostichus eleginoides]|uniref:Myb/SANT-like DNA-binding domain containing protein 2 n=1 Tax=Dissostichus eleginoides TaxID=100907 RepID=A0AAD9CPG2_DISEL|nr:Myb/SANT-like DNA-binding domain containing protein 2 [Dissostichus eleginoides]